ncbi:hypothetical protein CTAYLR_007157 [Chrysophaeum taylorii]|uniref:Transmembrane protein n=1 Tax=Chrysophaeum taylorii TaxID=2483200 RepID=A0AAD7UMU7_9STRA|nr:hypothetical protein CTAYLR_007157 [Chrysophaeum taylorii]
MSAAVKGEEKTEPVEITTEHATEKGVGHGKYNMSDHLKTLLVVISLMLVMAVVILSGVERASMLGADGMACNAAKEGKCQRSEPWQWGLTTSFGFVYSYRLLSSGVMAIMFLMFALFLALALHLSYGMTRKWMPIHNITTIILYGCIYIGLLYFMFALEAMVHIKYPSYKPTTFWEPGDTETIDNPHNPPYERFLRVVSWFTFCFALVTFGLFGAGSLIPFALPKRSFSPTTTEEPASHSDEA